MDLLMDETLPPYPPADTRRLAERRPPKTRRRKRPGDKTFRDYAD